MKLIFQTISHTITNHALASVVIIACLVFLILWWVPKKQIALLQTEATSLQAKAALLQAKAINAKDVFEAEKDVSKAENDARATIAQILGGAAVLIGLVIAWQNITTTKKGQITDRFYKAIEQLGAIDDKGEPKLELRLGGIYALERIAQDSKTDYWPIMEVLTAYVRENSHKQTTQRKEDIQTILTVISRLRERDYEYKGPDSKWLPFGPPVPGHRLDLNGADLQGMDLQDALLYYTDLVKANLRGTDLRHAKLAGARLTLANLEMAHMEYIDLQTASLIGANLENTHLENARLIGTNLWNAKLGNAHLEGAYLFSASAERGKIIGAHLEGAYLNETDIKIEEGEEGTIWKGVTQEQVDSAIGDETTGLPVGIVMPKSWKKNSFPS